MKFAQVLFDLDGTLIDSLRDLHQSVNHVLALYGRPPLPAEGVRGYIGDGVRVLLSRSFLGWQETEPPADSRAAPPPGAGATVEELERARQASIAALLARAREMRSPSLDEAVKTFRAHYAEHLLDHTVLYPGVAEALRRLRDRGAALAVVSNKPQLHSDKILAGLGVRPFFQAVVGGDALPVTKPDPAPLLLALEILWGRPETAWMVGDSGNDLLAGRKAGCRIAAVAYGLNDVSQLLPYRPDLVLNDLRELLETKD
ncbi:MAG: HAD-IA family hydrolase [Planctomycetes bacterium]|nr:HAD-IA family hydrolase [Planctomycetota bacterium]